MKQLLSQFILLFTFTLSIQFSYSQEAVKEETPVFISEKVNLTTQGISNIPNMSLGKPAISPTTLA